MNTRVIGAGAALLAAGAVVQARVRAAERAHQPLGRFVEVDGVRLHYLEAGSGPPVVLLHGLGSMVEEMILSGLVAAAAARYRVLAFDRPGYGHSARPRGLCGPAAQAGLLNAALRRLDIHRPVIVGHSWGALLAATYALERPGAARGLVLMSGLYFPSLRLDFPLLAPPGIPVLGALLRHTVSPLLARAMWPAWLATLFAPQPVPRRFGAFPTWMALRPSQLRAVAHDTMATLPATLALRRRLGDLRLPLAIVAGEEDRYVDPQEHSLRLHRLLPHSRLFMAAGAGHMVHHADPAKAVAAIDAVIPQ